MATLADKAILSGADNHPPMLEKDMYDSWKSIMELYMMNRQHGRMILEFVKNGPLIWPTIEENGVTRPKRYSELSAMEEIQADCDFKETNIILQGLPPEVYALVSNHKVAKELSERTQLLMQGTSLTKQERECKLFDEFDKFAFKKGKHYEQFQVNTKFLNTLPPEWSKFVTYVKLVRDLHTTNIDQLHAYLGQHEFHANEVRLMHERNLDPLALPPQYGLPYQSQQYSNNPSSTPLSITYPSNDYQSSIHHNVYSPSSSIPQLVYAPSVNQQSEFPQPDSDLIVPVFQKGDDPIDAINHMMSFLTVVVTSRYPTTNDQLRNSSNPRQQATINDGRCIKPKRKWDDSWFKDKVLLVQAQANGQILHEEELAFLADPRITEVALMAKISHDGSDSLAEVHNPDNVYNNLINQGVQVVPSSKQSNATVQNSNSSTQQDAFILSVIEQLKTQVVNCTKINLDNKSVNDTLTAKLERYKEQVKVLKEGQNVDIKSNDNVLDSSAQFIEIDHLKQTLSEHLKEKESLIQTVTLLKNDFKKEESRNIDREIALEKRIKQLDNILEPKLYDGNVIKNTSAIVIPESKETLMLAEESRSKMLLKQKDPMMLEKKVNTTPVDYDNSVNSLDPTLLSRPTKVKVPKELPKVSMVNTSLKKLKHHLAGFDVVVKVRTTTTTITEGSWGFEHTKACFRDEIIPFVKALKDLFNTFDQYLIDELSEVQNVFYQMEQAVEQHCLESKTFEVKLNKVLNENERLSEQVINKDIVNIIMNSSVDNACVNMHECEKCLKLKIRLLKKKDFIEKEIMINCSKALPLLKNIASL
ncbi:hypothetical protein Tco_1320100 [Tanacetum coccineum]